jgi:hypothetical protein
VITPSATRTVERAATGQGSLAWIEIALFAILAVAVSLVLMPGVRRRLLPLLAGAPSPDGYVGPTGNQMTPVAGPPPAPEPAAAPEPATAPEPGPPPAPEPATAVELAPAAATALEPAAAVEPAAVPAPEPATSQPQAEPASGDPQLPAQAEQSVTARSWAREHATQGALVATVIAGGLVRMLKRGRGR